MNGLLICQYDDLCEVFTDKLVAKIPSTATGKVTEINFGDDEIAPVGHVLLKIESTDGETETVEVDAAVPEAVQPAQSQTHETTSSTKSVADKLSTAPPGNQPVRSGKALSTPAVRFLAKKEGIDISLVPGTGKGGRVTKTDLLDFIKSGGQPTQQTQSASAGTNTVVQRGHTIAPLTGITEEDT